MPQRPSKGPSKPNAGSQKRGGQKAAFGSAVDPDVAAARDEAEDIEVDSPAGDPEARRGPAGPPGSTATGGA
jgi:hypothetical protein